MLSPTKLCENRRQEEGGACECPVKGVFFSGSSDLSAHQGIHMRGLLLIAKTSRSPCQRGADSEVRQSAWGKLHDSWCQKRWSCPVFPLWPLGLVCAASRLSCLMQQKARQSKENEFFARLVSRISLFLRASWREVLGLYGLGLGREKAMCRQKITLLGGADYLGWLLQSCAWSICSWVSTKMQTQWSLSCRETMLISVCLSPLLFNAGSLSNICLGDILYFHKILLKQPVSHKRTNMFKKKKKIIQLLIKSCVL